jgi:hypothetical protein
VRDAEHVGIDGERWARERDRQHDVGGLAPDPGQRFELLAFGRDLAGVKFDERSRGVDDVLGLGAKEATRFDDRFDVGLLRARKRRGIRVFPE